MIRGFQFPLRVSIREEAFRHLFYDGDDLGFYYPISMWQRLSSTDMVKQDGKTVEEVSPKLSFPTLSSLAVQREKRL